MSVYLVCLGGSGSKVLEAVTHMAAMGQWENEELHLLLVDVDGGNGNYERAKNVAECYQSIQSLQPDYHLFRSPLHLYCWSPAMPEDNLSSLGAEVGNGALLGYHFFTKNERNMSVVDGFKGHPNLGVLFMQQILDSRKAGNDDALEQFVNAARDNQADRILLAGSCYGGTGASCIPIIGTYLRKQLGSGIALGLLAILPSFAFFKTSKDPIDPRSEEFNHRVKTVLNTYIEQKVLKYRTQQDGKTVELDLYEKIYLIGSYKPSPFPQYAPGSSLQKNPATFFDWFACAAIKEYCTNQNPKQPDVYTAYIQQARWGWHMFDRGSFPTLHQYAAKLMTVFGLFIAEIYPAMNDWLNTTSRRRLKDNPFKFYFEDIQDHKPPLLQVHLNQFTKYSTYLIHWFFQIITTLPDDYFPALQNASYAGSLSQTELDERMDALHLDLNDAEKATLRMLYYQKFFSVPAMLHMLRFCQQTHFQGEEESTSTEEYPTFLDDAYRFFTNLFGKDEEKSLGVLLPKIVNAPFYSNAFSDRLMGNIFADEVYSGPASDAVRILLKRAFQSVD